MVPEVDYMSSRFTLKGSQEDIETARALLRTRQPVFLTFGAVAPVDLDANAHDAMVAAWGCGRPEIAQVVEDVPGRLSITCDTGTGIPHLALKALSGKLPGLEVELASLWYGETSGHSFVGSWKGGEGGLKEVEATREHYRTVRPDIEDWELDDLFGDAPAP